MHVHVHVVYYNYTIDISMECTSEILQLDREGSPYIKFQYITVIIIVDTSTYSTGGLSERSTAGNHNKLNVYFRPLIDTDCINKMCMHPKARSWIECEMCF